MSKNQTSENVPEIQQAVEKELADLRSKITIKTVMIEDENSGDKKEVLHAAITDLYKLGNNLENLSESAKSFFKNIKSAEFTASFSAQDTTDFHLKNLRNLCPNLETVSLRNTYQEPVPTRYFATLDQFENLKNSFDYFGESYEGYESKAFEAISHSFLRAKELMPQARLEVEVKDKKEVAKNRESLRLTLSQADLDQIDDDLRVGGNPLSLETRALFSSVRSITLSGEFAERNSFETNLKKLHKLAPNLEGLDIDVQSLEGYIEGVRDFSYLENFTKLKRLQLPVPLVADFKFLNKLNLTDLDATIPISTNNQGYRSRTSESISRLLSEVEDHQLESLEKFSARYCPISQEVFEKLCENVDGLQDLTLSADKLSDFSSLSKKMLRLENLEIISLQTSEGFNLPNLKRLELVSPRRADFSVIADGIKDLESLTISSSYDNESKRDFKWSKVFEGAAKLQKLETMSIGREIQSPMMQNGSSYSSYSGGASRETINDSVINQLLQAKKLKNFDINGFGFEVEGVELKGHFPDIGKEVTNLVAKRRFQPDSTIDPQAVAKLGKDHDHTI